MTPQDALMRLGGVATRKELLTVVAEDDLAVALQRGQIVRTGRAQLHVGEQTAARALARSHGGILAGESAALAWGWKVKTVPARPDVLVPRNHARRTNTVLLIRRDVPAEHRGRFALSRVATVLDCARRLPFDHALTVADSALRAGVAREDLAAAVPDLAGRRARQVRAVIAAASPLAENPFESVTRAIALEVPGLSVVPQVSVSGHGHADLADTRLRIAIECDSWEFHGDRDSFRSDRRRSLRMTTAGWLVVRLTWEDVMFRQPWVREQLTALVAVAEHAALHTFGVPEPTLTRA